MPQYKMQTGLLLAIVISTLLAFAECDPVPRQPHECLGLSDEECRSVVWGSAFLNRREPDACVYAQFICGGQRPGQERGWDDATECMTCFFHNVGKMGGCGEKEFGFFTWALSQCESGCVPSNVCPKRGRCGYQPAGCGNLVLCRCQPGFECRDSVCVPMERKMAIMSCPCPWGYHCKNSTCWRIPSPPPPQLSPYLGPSGWAEGPDLYNSFGRGPSPSEAFARGPAPPDARVPTLGTAPITISPPKAPPPPPPRI